MLISNQLSACKVSYKLKASMSKGVSHKKYVSHNLPLCTQRAL